MSKKRLAIFASGKGSNALNIIHHLKGNPQMEVVFVLSNKKDAPILEHAKATGVQTYFFDNQQTADGTFLSAFCQEQKIDFIILAGYLRLIPSELIHHFPDKIINIHPALLPKFGGKGMYGSNVHKAVLEAKESITGISIHFVNSEFDSGRILAQFTCSVQPTDDLELIESKIHLLEQAYYPIVIEKTILNYAHV
ncbi:MAG: phosphoribosylglycinamide formyltransferase [Crocinitomicaceae bacterium]|nr:phosphoribosylglycinamide formyltransferase [Crocinitomicaceae bacterium]